ncbi:isochorismate synthase [Xenorhabdus sp. Flor]|uniref:isochorismate synthase n=1 Tax=Xenorhabdus cabanillasii TaxID=351673 RepID=UPI0019C6688D|nr:isochorismate synthase [Xenorhabdus sp. Flor]MBD2815937.1 isochorismate synthase [Xenorhabdus sp. Flor]
MRRDIISQYEMEKNLVERQLDSAPFFFSSPYNTMMGVGVKKIVETPIPFTKLATNAKQLLNEAKSSEIDNPVLFGIIPFHEKYSTRFVIPKRLYVSSNICPQKVHPSKKNRFTSGISTPTRDGFKQGVKGALDLFEMTELSKVVLSRVIELNMEKDICFQTLLKNLLLANPNAYTFAANIDDRGTKLIGASPELLVAKAGNRIISNPLAGSRPLSPIKSENDSARQSLLTTEKDLHEHRIVVEEVKRIMSHYCDNLYIPTIPSVIETQSMLHLSTLLEGHSLEPTLSVLQVATKLHPTPAVCGYPREKAYKTIRDLECFERGYFTGMLGWCDSRGNGEWVVTIRCAEVQKRQLRIFAGAGIVAQSIPQSELEETDAKMATMLNAAGVEPNGQPIG